MGVVELEGERGRLGRDQRVDDDQASLTLDHVHVGQVGRADLIDAGRHLVEPAGGDELGLAPEAGVDRVGRLAVEDVGELGEVPDHSPSSVGDPAPVRELGEEAPGDVVEVVGVVEREGIGELPVGRTGVIGCRLGRGHGVLR